MDILWTKNAAKDIAYWKKNNPKTLARIKTLIADIEKHPYEGIGKPEALRHALSGMWSRRITREHRLLYTVEEERIIILACRHHY